MQEWHINGLPGPFTAGTSRLSGNLVEVPIRHHADFSYPAGKAWLEEIASSVAGVAEVVPASSGFHLRISAQDITGVTDDFMERLAASASSLGYEECCRRTRDEPFSAMACSSVSQRPSWNR